MCKHMCQMHYNEILVVKSQDYLRIKWKIYVRKSVVFTLTESLHLHCHVYKEVIKESDCHS